MAKGANSKIQVAQQILKTFSGAFEYNGGKEIRIPMVENGEEVQIKVALTCAKDNVVPGDENALPGTATVTTAQVNNDSFDFSKTTETEIVHSEPTAEEKQNVKSLLEALGL